MSIDASLTVLKMLFEFIHVHTHVLFDMKKESEALELTGS